MQLYNTIIAGLLIKFNNIVALTNKIQIVLCFSISEVGIFFKFWTFFIQSKTNFSLCFKPSFKLLI